MIQPKRVLVTGATGFVGSHLRAALATSWPDTAVIAGTADLRDKKAVAAMVDAATPDACVHLGAVSSPASVLQDQENAWAVNLGGTLHVAEALHRHVPQCRLIFASSSEVYGDSFRLGRPLNEEAVLAPSSLYGVTKAAADLALGAMSRSGLQVVRLRLFNHTGPGQTTAFVVPVFARQVASIQLGHTEPILNVGALEPARDFLDIRDVCSAYMAALSCPGVPAGTILNIASGTARRIGDILSELWEIAGIRPDIRTDPARLRPNDIPFACGDASHARQLLGWAPKIPWRQTLTSLLEDWRSRLSTPNP